MSFLKGVILFGMQLWMHVDTVSLNIAPECIWLPLKMRGIVTHFCFRSDRTAKKIFLIALIGRISRMKNSTLRKAQRHTCSWFRQWKILRRFTGSLILVFNRERTGSHLHWKQIMGTWRNRIPYIRDDYWNSNVTPQESLALQGFPENFVFPSIPIASAYKQCGNTVAVPVIKAIAKEMLNTCMWSCSRVLIPMSAKTSAYSNNLFDGFEPCFSVWKADIKRTHFNGIDILRCGGLHGANLPAALRQSRSLPSEP